MPGSTCVGDVIHGSSKSSIQRSFSPKWSREQNAAFDYTSHLLHRSNGIGLTYQDSVDGKANQALLAIIVVDPMRPHRHQVVEHR